MGMNMAGLVINHNYEKDIEKLGEDLDWDIEIVGEIPFDNASLDSPRKDEFHLHFTKNGTMIFFDFDWIDKSFKSNKHDTLNYVYAETSMAFQVDFFSQGKMVRSFGEHEEERMMERGSPLALEEENETADELIMALIKDLLGESFWDIDTEATCFRCRKKKRKVEQEPPPISKVRKSSGPPLYKGKVENDPKVRAIINQSPALQDLFENELNPNDRNDYPDEGYDDRPYYEQERKWWEFWK